MIVESRQEMCQVTYGQSDITRPHITRISLTCNVLNRSVYRYDRHKSPCLIPLVHCSHYPYSSYNPHMSFMAIILTRLDQACSVRYIWCIRGSASKAPITGTLNTDILRAIRINLMRSETAIQKTAQF